MVVGDGSNHVTLSLPLITDESDPGYCGVRVNKVSKGVVGVRKGGGVRKGVSVRKGLVVVVENVCVFMC